jgi:hypothetical protein
MQAKFRTSDLYQAQCRDVACGNRVFLQPRYIGEDGSAQAHRQPQGSGQRPGAEGGL